VGKVPHKRNQTTIVHKTIPTPKPTLKPNPALTAPAIRRMDFRYIAGLVLPSGWIIKTISQIGYAKSEFLWAHRKQEEKPQNEKCI
jgi:hypothetical protein